MHVAHEGPRDPRRRQPARRRAVRPHRRGRLRPVRAAGRRGRGRVPGDVAEAGQPRVPRTCGSSCRSMRTCPHEYVPASGCGSRPTGRSPTVNDRRRASTDGRATSWSTATARCPSRSATCSRWPRFRAARAARPGSPSRAAGQQHQLRPGRAARVAGAAAAAALPAQPGQGAVADILVPRPMTAADRRPAGDRAGAAAVVRGADRRGDQALRLALVQVAGCGA